MKNLLLRVSALLLTGMATIAGYAFSPQLDGTMMPYDFAAVDSTVPWGNDMKPVFVNYVARHGARYLSSAKKTEGLTARLETARQEGRLTRKGEAFLRLLQRIDSVTDGRWGALNPLGIEEEQRLGKELAATVPQLLKEGDVKAESSYVPRVVMTMYEFCHSLADYSTDLNISTTEGKHLNPLLRFFTTDKPYAEYLKEGPWRYAYDNYARNTLPVRPAASLINEVTDSKELQKLSLDAYGVLQSLSAAGIDADPAEWFTEEEYEACWKVSNLQHYYQRSVSTFSPLPAQSAKPIIIRFAENAERAFRGETGDRKADLLFGHAETVLPLFAAMRLPGCYSPGAMPQDVWRHWKDWEISPLGANLMMVCLQDGTGKGYVSLRLNGHWVEIEGKKVIEWEELGRYWGVF